MNRDLKSEQYPLFTAPGKNKASFSIGDYSMT